MGLGMSDIKKEEIDQMTQYLNAPAGTNDYNTIKNMLMRPEEVTGSYREGSINGSQFTRGVTHTSPYSDKKLIFLKNLNNPVVEGMIASHENNHATTDQNLTRLPVPKHITNKYKDNPAMTKWYKYVSAKNELDARNEEVHHFNRMLDAGYSNKNNSSLNYKLKTLSDTFNIFGDKYGQTNKDYNQTKINRINNFIKK